MSTNLLDRAIAERDALVRQLNGIADRLDAEDRRATADEDTMITALLSSLDEAQEQVDDLEAVKANREVAKPALGRGRFVGRRHGNGEHDDAHRVLESEHRSGRLPDFAAERCESLITTEGIASERSTAGRWITAAGNPDYRGAFAKPAADPQRGTRCGRRPNRKRGRPSRPCAASSRGARRCRPPPPTVRR